LGERLPYKQEVAGSIPAPPTLWLIPCLAHEIGFAAPPGGYTWASSQAKEGGELMLWLIAGIVLLIIAIAGGAIVHPVLFALAIVALVVFFMGRGTRTV
jgi:hypothetical protein